MTGIEGAAQSAPDLADYVVLEPGRLVVTHLHEGDFEDDSSFFGRVIISVVRHESVELGSELYKPVLTLTAGLERIFHMVDGGTEVSLFEVAA